MNPLLARLLLLLPLLALAPRPAQAGGGTLVEIFYLPHRPAVAVVERLEKVAAEQKQVTIRKYSFEDPASRDLRAKYQLTEHMPVAVFINGVNNFTVNGRTLRLRNFPKGDAFVPMFAGEWDYDDIRAILASRPRGK